MLIGVEILQSLLSLHCEELLIEYHEIHCKNGVWSSSTGYLRCSTSTSSSLDGRQWSSSTGKEFQGLQYRLVCLYWWTTLWYDFQSEIPRPRLTIFEGYNQGVFSGVLVMNSFKGHMQDYASDRPEDQSKKGWLTSILELGAWFGCLFSGFVAEVFSRKRGILFATGIFILGVVIQVRITSSDSFDL
jgi:hypothetical protein